MAGIQASIGGDASKAYSVLDQFQAKAESTASRIAKGFQERIGHRIFDGLMRAAAALPTAMKGAIDAGGRLSDQMARTGAAGEGLVILERALTNAGMSADSTTRLLGLMQKGLAGVNEEMQSTSTAFEVLNLDMENLRSMDPVAAFEEIGREIMKVEDPAQRAALAMRIFGRSGAEALVAFSDTTGMATARAELGQLPGVLAASAQSLDVVSDRLANLGTGWQQIGAAAAVSVLPALEKITGQIAAMDLTGIGQVIGKLLNMLVDFAPAILAVGAAMAGLKITAMIASLMAKTKAWWAQTAAIQANTAALAKNAAASRGAATAGAVGTAGMAGKGALALMGGPVGLSILAASAAAMFMFKKANEAEQAVNSMGDAYKRNSAAMRKYELESIKTTVTTRDGIKEVITAIEAEQEAILKAAAAQAENEPNRRASKSILEDAEKTVAMLDVRIRQIRTITQAQLDENAVTAAAAAAQIEYAAAVEKAAEAYKKLREQHQQRIDQADEQLDLTGPLKAQLEELDRVQETIFKKFSASGVRGTSQEIITGIAGREDSPEKTADLELAIRLAKIEETRAATLKKIAEEEEKSRQSRADALADWNQEMQILAATVQGEKEKVEALEREAEIRAEINRLIAAGFSDGDAMTGATRLVDARRAAEAAKEEAEAEERRNEARARGRDIALDAFAAAQGEAAAIERAVQKRANEIADQSGLDRPEAEAIARNESTLDQLTRLRSQADGMQLQSSIGAISDMQRIGGGGAVIDSGIDIARQQADLQRQMVTLLAQIAARTPEQSLQF